MRDLLIEMSFVVGVVLFLHIEKVQIDTEQQKKYSTIILCIESIVSQYSHDEHCRDHRHIVLVQKFLSKLDLSDQEDYESDDECLLDNI